MSTRKALLCLCQFS